MVAVLEVEVVVVRWQVGGCRSCSWVSGEDNKVGKTGRGLCEVEGRNWGNAGRWVERDVKD